MIPFQNTWPYDIIMGDIYVHHCPYCAQANVLIPMKPHEIVSIHEGKKKLLVFPCCHNKITIVDTDPDYLLCDQPVR
ncbi:hypothetical protein [Paenibacillus glacialis]|uniref:Uncharacterized protein n=1 Tax=Paenibacillus glacialis TaxID=494026 RepID=A0A168P1E1_9BACL|nr:hypothetical protein [Paenibacillus glacialis]OAB46292.1 hypothetical protein PGLA_02620 [Paenibacillus glacialis]